MAERRPSEAPIVVMGVSGCGKSSVGAGIAVALGLDFVEGDALHPPENIARMSAGIPLTDEDRWPWLDRVAARLAEAKDGRGVVVSCSALKVSYRERLRAGAGRPLRFVFLTGSRCSRTRLSGILTRGSGIFVFPEKVSKGAQMVLESGLKLRVNLPVTSSTPPPSCSTIER